MQLSTKVYEEMNKANQQSQESSENDSKSSKDDNVQEAKYEEK